MEVEPAVAQFARRQHGLVTRHQALAVGLTPSAIRVRVAKGSWLTIRRTVYAVAGVRPSPEQAVLAVCLAARRGCWVSHRSAASIWGLQIPPPGAIEVTTPLPDRLHLAGVRQHRSAALYPADLVRHRLVPLTSVARTLVDCAPHLPGRRLGRAVDDADRRGLLDVVTLARCVERLDEPGRHGLGPLRRVVAARLEGRVPGGSEAELDVLDILRAGGVPLPVQQYELFVDGHRRILDYAYPDEKVGLEFDGFKPHATIRSVFDDGAIRGNDLAVTGWLILHFTSRTPPSHVVARTFAALARRRRPTELSPSGAGALLSGA